MSRLLTLGLVLFALSAVAKSRVAVVSFEGPKAAKVKAQVAKKLCAKFTCVKPGKSKKMAVDAVVTGAVIGRELELKVYVSEDAEPVSRTLALSKKGKLTKKGLAELPAAVNEALAAASAAQEEAEEDDGGGSTAGAAP